MPNLLDGINRRSKIYEAVKNYPERDDCHNDEYLTKLAIEYQPTNYKYVSDELKNNKELALFAVNKHGGNLQYVSDELKNDKDVVLTAINKQGNSYVFIGDKLKDDKDVALSAVNTYYDLPMRLSENLKSDESIAIACIKKNPLSLRLFDENIRGNSAVVRLAYKLDRTTLRYASDSAFSSEDLVIDVIQPVGNVVGANRLTGDMPTGLFKAIGDFGYTVKFATQNLNFQTLERDKFLYLIKCGDVVFGKKYETFLKYVDTDDSAVVEELLKKKVISKEKAKSLIPYALKLGRIRVMPILLQYSRDSSGKTRAVKDDRTKLLRGLVKKTVTSVKTLRENLDEYKLDKEVMELGLEADGRIFFLVSDLYGDNLKFVRISVNSYVVFVMDKPFLSYVGKSVLKDKGICYTACKKDCRNYPYVDETLLKDDDFDLIKKKYEQSIGVKNA